ncbi:ABC transporter [Mycena venus]|uniref:ABC transporter n=1 Tax=Mycena venus TaxID=2733690 RepID=A0A8H7CCY5_9AGAR|nr:ABC transporter [Mycena venus]
MASSDHNSDNEKQDEPQGSSFESTLLTGKKLGLVFMAFMLGYSLVALDQTIISTALPTIASKFQAVSDLSWIASAYFLPQATFMLFFGALLRVLPPKGVLLVSISIFELGSVFCAVAPSVDFLIFGRAVAGLGGAGLWVTVITVMARMTTLEQRPIFMGLVGSFYAVSSVVGPLVGGAFTDHVSWRQVVRFKVVVIMRLTPMFPDVDVADINLPIGALAIVAILFLLPNFPPPMVITTGFWQRIKNLDWIGTILSLAMVVSLLLPLQWGGNEKPWNAPEVIALLVLFIVLLVAFIVFEIKYGSNAVFPSKVLFRRNMIGAVIATAILHSAGLSSLQLLSATITVGAIITKFGHPRPFLVAGPAIACIGFGLLFTVHQDTNAGKIAGFQILVGLGLGFAIQNTLVIAQTEFASEQDLVPQATSMITFIQLIGSAIGLAVFGAVFAGQIRSKLNSSGLPREVIQAVLGDIKIISSLPTEQQNIVIPAYIDAVDHVFLVGIAAGALASLGACLIRRSRNVKDVGKIRNVEPVEMVAP